MSETKPVDLTDPLEILAQWEGPAIHESGLQFVDQEGEHAPPEEANTADLAAWIAVTAISDAVGDAASAAIKAKVVEVLFAWQQRFGPVKIDEVKQRLIQFMQQYRNNRKISEEELRERIERLFEEIAV